MHTFSQFVRPYQRLCAAFPTVPVGNQIADSARAEIVPTICLCPYAGWPGPRGPQVAIRPSTSLSRSGGTGSVQIANHKTGT
jgi:hypothetical protein